MPDILSKRRHLGVTPSELGHRSRGKEPDARAEARSLLPLAAVKSCTVVVGSPGAGTGVSPGVWPARRAARGRGLAGRRARSGARGGCAPRQVAAPRHENTAPTTAK